MSSPHLHYYEWKPTFVYVIQVGDILKLSAYQIVKVTGIICSKFTVEGELAPSPHTSLYYVILGENGQPEHQTGYVNNNMHKLLRGKLRPRYVLAKVINNREYYHTNFPEGYDQFSEDIRQACGYTEPVTNDLTHISMIDESTYWLDAFVEMPYEHRRIVAKLDKE